jgi:hypothetical protein
MFREHKQFKREFAMFREHKQFKREFAMFRAQAVQERMCHV